MTGPDRPPVIEPFPAVELVADEILSFALRGDYFEVTLGRLRPALGAMPAERHVVARILLHRDAVARGAATRQEAVEILERLIGPSGRA